MGETFTLQFISRCSKPSKSHTCSWLYSTEAQFPHAEGVTGRVVIHTSAFKTGSQQELHSCVHAFAAGRKALPLPPIFFLVSSRRCSLSRHIFVLIKPHLQLQDDSAASSRAE